MNALYQRSQGIPRLINIIADRALVAAFVKERLDVTAHMVHEAANEVQLGERQVSRVRWPWLLGATAVLAVAVVSVMTFDNWLDTANIPNKQVKDAALPVTEAIQEPQAAAVVLPEPDPATVSMNQEVIAALDPDWLENHQFMVWQGLAELWQQPGAAFAIQSACNGDNSSGYACLHDQGSWSKIKRLGLPVVLVLPQDTPKFLLLQGIDNERLLVGSNDQLTTVSRDSVGEVWLGAYLVAWPQASDWPSEVSRGDDGPAVATIMEMATLVDVPYHGDKVFDLAFENWLKGFQTRNGLEADGIIGRNTLLHLMTASITEPQLLNSWN